MVAQAKLKSFHPDEATRAARIGWNALLNLAKTLPNFSPGLTLVGSALAEMNKNDMFDKPGEVLQGPIEGDIGGTPVRATKEEVARDGWRILLGED